MSSVLSSGRSPVYLLVSGVSAKAARIGFRSMDAAQASVGRRGRS